MVGVEGGLTRGVGVWVIGVTTFIGLWGLNKMKDGEALTVLEEGRALLCFSSGVMLADGDGGPVEGSEVRPDGGGGDVEKAEVSLTSGLGFSAGSGGVGTIFTTATAGEAPSSAQQIQDSHHWEILASCYGNYICI